MMEMAKEVELANYRQWDELEKVQQKKFELMKDIAVVPTNNKRYIKVNEYETLLAEEEENGIKNVEYEERLIDYDENYKSYDLYLEWNRPKIFY